MSPRVHFGTIIWIVGMSIRTMRGGTREVQYIYSLRRCLWSTWRRMRTTWGLQGIVLQWKFELVGFNKWSSWKTLLCARVIGDNNTTQVIMMLKVRSPMTLMCGLGLHRVLYDPSSPALKHPRLQCVTAPSASSSIRRKSRTHWSVRLSCER